jgi:putative endonuclease
MKDDRCSVGREAEELAAAAMENDGFRIVSRNFRTRRAEIDLVARKKELLVFVEVRSQRGRYLSSAVLTVNPAKRRQILMGAQAYLSMIRTRRLAVRFDVIGVQFHNGGHELQWITDAFRAPDLSRSKIMFF